MARRDAAIEDLLATEKPGLKEFIEGEDARLDADRDVQQKLLDRRRWEKILKAQSDVDDVGEDEFMRDGIIGPLVDTMTDHAAGDYDAASAQRTRAKRPRDPKIRFADEIDAYRSHAAAHFEVRAGAIHRLGQQIKLGATIQTSVRNVEPTGDPCIDAVGDAIQSLTRAEQALLDDVHSGFERPWQPTAHEISMREWEQRIERWEAAKDDPERGERPGFKAMLVPKHLVNELQYRDERQTETQLRERFELFWKWYRRGRKIAVGEEAVEYGGVIGLTVPSLGAIAMARIGRLPRGSNLLAEGLRWEHMVAERLGMNISRELGPIDPHKKAAAEEGVDDGVERRMTYLEESRRAVRALYNAAREKLRRALVHIELDCTCVIDQREREKRGAPKKSITSCKHVRWVIPAPTSRELDADARSEGADGKVPCCAGMSVRDGVRVPCEVVIVEGPVKRHPSRAWRRCDVCRKPVVEVAGR